VLPAAPFSLKVGEGLPAPAALAATWLPLALGWCGYAAMGVFFFVRCVYAGTAVSSCWRLLTCTGIHHLGGSCLAPVMVAGSTMCAGSVCAGGECPGVLVHHQHSRWAWRVCESACSSTSACWHLLWATPGTCIASAVAALEGHPLLVVIWDTCMGFNC
jgi:hypothetical protein